MIENCDSTVLKIDSSDIQTGDLRDISWLRESIINCMNIGAISRKKYFWSLKLISWYGMFGSICNNLGLFFSLFNFKELNSKLPSCKQLNQRSNNFKL